MADGRSVIRSEHRLLREKYLELRATGYSAGADRLYELERLAWASFEREDSELRLISLALATVFGWLAKGEETEAAPSADYGRQMHGLLDQPIATSLDILAGRNGGSHLLQALSRLAAAYAAARRLHHGA